MPTTPKHPGGRPRKEPALRRTRKSELTWNATEWQLLSDAAEAVGEPVATYLRRIALLRAREDLARAAQFRR